ncbi:YqiA/YcfP family alpha/beta fold hydrolase [Sorangium sp. So ce136]|uniref:YqiA/YcfP family alpha/beta fold hydrolase n=1 Tax=Sorangium sp. So ce136 TaxID=3133284 RepID=UPI003F10C264
MTITTAPSAAGPRWLYLHGFASGPSSTKGVQIAAHFGRRGVAVERLNLRVPSLERLRLSAMIEAVKQAIGGESDRAVVMGSSLGGLTACRVAAEDARVCALVLLAPAFRIMERWRQRLGEEGFRGWEERGWLEVDDYAEKRRARVDFGFAADAAEVDDRSGGWPDVRVPTLIVHGRHDEVVDIELSRAFAAAKRHVRLVEVDDGHELVASIPRILREADDFLRPFLGS